MQCLVLHSCKAVPGFVHLKRNTFTALKCTQRSTPATHAVGQATSGGSDAGNRATQQQEYVAAAIDTLAGIIDAKIEASRRVSPTTLILSMLGFGFLVCVGLASFPKGLAVVSCCEPCNARLSGEEWTAFQSCCTCMHGALVLQAVFMELSCLLPGGG